MSNKKTSLAKKLVMILSEAQKVKKSGINKFAGYQYTTEADLLEVIRPQLVKHGIFIFSSVEKVETMPIKTKKGEDSIITTVVTSHTFVDSETGEEFTVKSAGQGADPQDKGIYKSITGSTKYMLWKNFLIESNDDPENDNANVSYVRNSSSNSGKKVEASIPTKPKSFSKFNKNTLTSNKSFTNIVSKENENEKVTEEVPSIKSFGKREFIANKEEANF